MPELWKHKTAAAEVGQGKTLLLRDSVCVCLGGLSINNAEGNVIYTECSAAVMEQSRSGFLLTQTRRLHAYCTLKYI